MPIRLELDKNFRAKFNADVQKEVKKQLISSIPASIKRIKKRIQEDVTQRLYGSSVYGSLVNGTLEAEFGITDGPSRIADIIDLWVSSIEVRFDPSAGSLGGISIGIFRSGWGDVLSSAAAEFTAQNKKGQGTTLQWLKWLLLEGDRVIVANYKFEPSNKGSSRTGEGIMIRTRGGGWGVPPQFAGVENDNFATRALEGIQDTIDYFVRQEITKGL